MPPRLRGPRAVVRPGLLAALLPTLAGCRGDPVEPELPVLEVVIGGGDGQYATFGQELPEPLHAVVRIAETGLPRKDVTLLWEVEQGSASFVGVPTTVTDSTGSAQRRLQLGAEAGEVRVRAAVVDQETASVEFVAHAVEVPALTSLSVSSAAAGDTVTLAGSDFSPVADQDVVLFSGIRGRVTAASAEQLEVEVPSCLGERDVDVSVQLGAVATDPLTLTVTGGGPPARELEPGEVIDVTDETGLTCLRLAGGAGYLTLVTSASTVGAVRHDYVLTGLADPGPIVADAGPAPTTPLRGGAPAPSDPQARLHDRIRAEEKRLVASGPRWVPSPEGAAAAPAPVPTVGETRGFKVLNPTGGFDDVVAVARHVGERGVIYVDQSAPSGGLTDADLADFAARFDGPIHSTVTDLYGSPSDLDGNQRVVVLFTPVVNRFTERGAQGFVGGFFFGLDLLPDRPNSNGGEVFYALVPDPEGTFSDARSKEQVLDVVPAILAHEFQHMVHFNERVLVRGAAATEALWLSEGLATMAEESVARAYEAAGDDASADLFRTGNLKRARNYLGEPASVSLIVTTGQGSLEERGAGWLHVLYLAQRYGEDVLGLLTRTTRTGTDNVTTRTGVAWPELTADWWAALYLDGIGPEDGRLEYPDMDLRALIGSDPYPLVPEEVGAADFRIARALWSSSAAYFELTPPGGGAVALRLGGRAGGPLPPAAALRLRIVRLP